MLGCVTASAAVDDPAVALPSTNAVLRPLGAGVFQLGSVRLDKRERMVTFAAKVNIVAELSLEYAVVNKTGKTHESLFRTETIANDVHVAMLLLGAQPALTNTFPQDLSVTPPGDHVTISVTWTNDGREVRHGMEELILNRNTGKPLSVGDWIYNGSNFSEGAFTAQRDGSIVSIHIDPDALVNNPRPGRDNDDLHIPNTKILPPLETPVQICIRLISSNKALTGKTP
jgi:hypothetical protein